MAGPLPEIPACAGWVSRPTGWSRPGLEAAHSLAAAHLALGEDPLAMPELEQLPRQHPFHEPFHGQLISPCNGRGRQADVLSGVSAAPGDSSGGAGDRSVNKDMVGTERHRVIGSEVSAHFLGQLVRAWPMTPVPGTDAGHPSRSDVLVLGEQENKGRWAPAASGPSVEPPCRARVRLADRHRHHRRRLPSCKLGPLSRQKRTATNPRRSGPRTRTGTLLMPTPDLHDHREPWSKPGQLGCPVVYRVAHSKGATDRGY